MGSKDRIETREFSVSPVVGMRTQEIRFQCGSLPRNAGELTAAEQSLKCDGKDIESTWMTRITVHYLAALSMDGQFWFNKFTKKKENRCPCSCAQKILYMDTNIGNPNTWYGKLDVILGCLDYEVSPDIGVMLAGGDKSQLSSDDSEAISTSNDVPYDEMADGDTSLSSNDDSPGGRTRAEVKLSSLEEISQIQAQTIVFSFYQKKRHPEVGLVPSISVSKTHIQFHFYDSAKDVYLMSRRMPLFQESGNSLSKVTALATWMVVNYKVLITVVTDEMEKETPFGLLTAFTPESLEYYKSGIVMADFEAEKDNIIEDRGRLYKRRNNVTAKCIKSFKKLR
ncbi:hypothetical protein FSP39_020392 [Pinctada imbricata]|uniref:Uncharacterized protein n=1 Tax=Pinctada imbricata TaxID=66713 RepID=A0AA88XSA7_PINIB|nr:hypothetical protein FSP39_020392 [Pinctada imbricata]